MSVNEIIIDVANVVPIDANVFNSLMSPNVTFLNLTFTWSSTNSVTADLVYKITPYTADFTLTFNSGATTIECDNAVSLTSTTQPFASNIPLSGVATCVGSFILLDNTASTRASAILFVQPNGALSISTTSAFVVGHTYNFVAYSQAVSATFIY